MLSNLKRYFKTLTPLTLRNLLKAADLTELEFWVSKYTFIEKRMVENICMKLNISRAYYFILKDKALIKIYYKLKELKKV